MALTSSLNYITIISLLLNSAELLPKFLSGFSPTFHEVPLPTGSGGLY